MPPNPARQARMAERRAQMDNDPELQQTARDAGEAVLKSYGQGEETPSVVEPQARAPGPSRPAAPTRPAAPIRGGGSGGGSLMKQNTGRKGALPPPDFDIKLFNYCKGGKVISSKKW